MNIQKTISIVSTLMLLAVAAQADWDIGDPYKMHYPQLPDPQGWDVLFNRPQVLADDWRCTESGEVSDVHFWFSSQQDREFEIYNVHLSIHEDIPAGTGGLPYSTPGQLLWDWSFSPEEFTVRGWGSGDQGWYDPRAGEYSEFDHQKIFQLNIEDIEKFVDPFIQKEGTIYWLDVTVAADVPLGWKTSRDHWNDDAVWTDLPTGEQWRELRDPITGDSLDLAFVIVPEPSAIAMIVITGAGFIFVRRRFMI